MIRLNQLLGTILLATVTTMGAAGAASELVGVQVDGRDHAGVVTITASGTFTHTEYRPTDSLLLVDLSGVSVAHPDTSLHSVSTPGVVSYRVVGYRYASGTEVARVELNLAPGAQVKVADIANGVEVRVARNGSSSPGEVTPAAAAPTPMSSGAVIAAKSARVSHIRAIAVARGKEGLDIEITANAPITGRTMKLSGPDRLVLDIPNSILEGGSQREITVHSNSVKDVRVARYQSAPPTTRVVVDLAGAGDFEMVSSANKLILKLKEPGGAASRSLAPAAKPEEKLQVPVHPVVAAAKAGEPGQAVVQPVASRPAETSQAASALVVTPAVSPKQDERPAQPKQQNDQPAESAENNTGQSRSALAAAHFSNPGSTAAATNQPPFPSNDSLAATPAVMNAALQRQQALPSSAPGQVVSSCTTGRYTGDPFSMNVKDLDLKDFFRLIHEISGLNIVLDPAVHGTLTIVLDDVPWDQALAIVLANNNLDCQLQGNVLRIATIDTLRTEAESRHAQQDAQSLAVPTQTVTRYLSYGHARDVAVIVKKFLSPRGNVVSDDRSNALIIEDIPGTIPKIDGLLPLLDRKTPQVEIEARVVSATRQFARDIGTQLAPGFANGHSALSGLSALGNSPIITNGLVPATSILTPPTTIGPTTGNLVGTAGQIPFFSSLAAAQATSGLTLDTFTKNFRLDFILSMAESRGLAKVLSRPRIVTQNNIKAVIKQGQKIPIITAGQLGGPATTSYLDVVLRLTVTPQITAENTIFLDIDVENTSVVGQIQANVNPTLSTAQTTTQVLVSDGGTVVIGGVIATQSNLNVAQVPLLGSIPLLGNIFRHVTVNTQTAELIFFITPKIVQS